MSQEGLLLLAYGTPENLADMGAYLLDIRGGRATPPELVAEMTERYHRIGGSPLTRLTFEQARNVELECRRRGRPLPVYVGMRHWTPWIKDAVARMQTDGIQRAAAIVMAPHFSSLSVGRYRARIEEAQQELGRRIEIRFVESWWEQPRFLEALEQNIRAGLARLDDPARIKTKLIFTAHSLPVRILQMGDPYDDQLKRNAAIMAERLSTKDWMFAYQSAGASAEPWLGPALEDVLPDLAAEGYRQVLVAPIGFVCDHVEILYDLDVEAREIAGRHQIHLERIPSMNSHPLFIQAVTDAVFAALT